MQRLLRRHDLQHPLDDQGRGIQGKTGADALGLCRALGVLGHVVRLLLEGGRPSGHLEAPDPLVPVERHEVAVNFGVADLKLLEVGRGLFFRARALQCPKHFLVKVFRRALGCAVFLHVGKKVACTVGLPYEKQRHWSALSLLWPQDHFHARPVPGLRVQTNLHHVLHCGREGVRSWMLASYMPGKCSKNLTMPFMRSPMCVRSLL